jgi:dTDP-4-dehydrorhamnose 3,5-epimerase
MGRSFRRADSRTHDLSVIFLPTALDGAFVIEQDRRHDDRGYFARTWCQREFEKMGLKGSLVQCSISHSLRRHTLRGMHWQASPHGEVKIVRCTWGVIWDVIIDLRPESPTYMRHVGVELNEESGRALYIPEGMAHGFVTLVDNSEAFYQMSEFHQPAFARGVRWNDPAFEIEWPVRTPILHPRDAAYPDYVSLVAR